MKVDQLVAAHREVVLDHQHVRWSRSMWEKVWSDGALPGRTALDIIDSEVDQHGTIRRSWLRGLADDDPATFLAATTIWGYGTFGRGVKALKAMLSVDDVAQIVSAIIDASRRDPASGSRSLFAAGKPRIPWLGVSYGTKLVHFAGYDHAELRPLILDRRVFLGAEALGVRVPDPARYTTGDEYAGYCAWADTVARNNGVEPDVVEYALFRYGRDARRFQRRRRASSELT